MLIAGVPRPNPPLRPLRPLQVLRAFRILRVFKLLRSWKSLQKLPGLAVRGGIIRFEKSQSMGTCRAVMAVEMGREEKGMDWQTKALKGS